MEVIKAFYDNGVRNNILMVKQNDQYLYRAKDIGKALGYSNIRVILKDYDDNEKIILTNEEPKFGNKSVLYLKERGLMKLLLQVASKKPIANRMTEWLCETIKENNTLTTNLQTQLQEVQQINNQLQHNFMQSIEIERQKIKEDIENKKKQAKIDRKNKKKVPTIYIYNTDNTKSIIDADLKIGMTIHLEDRIKPYNTVTPNGKIVYNKQVEHVELGCFEKYIHGMFKQFNIRSELFHMDQEEASKCIDIHLNLLKVHNEVNKEKRQQKINEIHKFIEMISDPEYVSPNESAPNIEYEIIEPPPTIQEEPPLIQNFEQFIREKCIVHDKAEVSAKDLVGAYRLYVHEAKKEVTKALFDYLKRKYKYDRLGVQDKNQVVNGFIGITLKSETYPRNQALLGTDADIFTFCGDIIFTPGGTTHWKDIWDEYQKWAESMKKTLDAKEDEKKLKEYLKSLPYVLFEVVWANNTSNQGFYGMKLKRDTRIYKTTSSTGCKIERVDMNGNSMKSFETIAKAAEEEQMCAAKMSRSVKAKVIFGSGENQYYYVKSTGTYGL